jgi:hypothetical protein
MLSTELIADATEKIEQKYTNIEYFQDQVVIVDNEKSLYDQGIVTIDADLYNSIEDLNDSFIGVQSAYQDRINVGCRTDMFWRVVGITTDEYGLIVDYTLTVTQLTGIGYSSVGIGTSTVDFLESSGSITQYSLDSIFGLQERKLYGLKYYDEPYAKDIGDTFVTSFIGTISLGSNKLTVMNPVGSGISEYFQSGQIVISSKDGVFPVLSTVKITGIGVTIVDLTKVNPGIGTSSSIVNILTLDTVASLSVKAPESDGSFVSFSVITDPAEVASEGRRKYELNFFKHPFVPQTVGIMTRGDIGIGVSMILDSSGNPSASQGWNPDMNGFEVDGTVITPPNVGADKIYYRVGFTETPSYLGVPKTLGQTITVMGLLSLYTNLSSCAAQETTLTTKIGIASVKETAFIADGGDVSLKINASNALRLERNQYNLRIWGLRQSIGGENEEIDRYDALKTYIGLSTISGTLG